MNTLDSFAIFAYNTVMAPHFEIEGSHGKCAGDESDWGFEHGSNLPTAASIHARAEQWAIAHNTTIVECMDFLGRPCTTLPNEYPRPVTADSSQPKGE